jgi:hypothetical protein
MYSARSALWADLSEHQLVEKDICLALRYLRTWRLAFLAQEKLN